MRVISWPDFDKVRRAITGQPDSKTIKDLEKDQQISRPTSTETKTKKEKEKEE